jgi:NADPH-dependent 2,4-dienoyl-CoA reductase/sulfur reductase-like enzyme
MTRDRRLDVVVIGAGPAGLAAADAAARLGKRVLVIDQAPRAGGQIWRHRDPGPLPAVARRLLAAVSPPRVAVAMGAAVVDAPSPERLLVSIGGRVVTTHTAALVLATGAVERLLPFPGWTLPGVVGVGAIQALIKSGLDLSGQRVVVAGTGPLIWPVARELARAGARVPLIADQATRATLLRFGASLATRPRTLAAALGFRAAAWRSPFRADSWVLRAEGSDRVTAAVVRIGGTERRIPCDWIATAAGLMPRTELGRLLGCATDRGAIAVDGLQATSVPGVWAAGECTGVSGDEGARLEGTIAGIVAAGGGDLPRALLDRRDRSRRFGERLTAAFVPRQGLRDRVTSDCVVCRCEDVRAGVIDPTWTARQAKLWTRVGMGPCQGAVCGAACAMLYGWEDNTVRPPLDGPTVAAWAGAIRAERPAAPPSPEPPAA